MSDSDINSAKLQPVIGFKALLSKAMPGIKCRSPQRFLENRLLLFCFILSSFRSSYHPYQGKAKVGFKNMKSIITLMDYTFCTAGNRRFLPLQYCQIQFSSEDHAVHIGSQVCDNTYNFYCQQ